MKKTSVKFIASIFTLAVCLLGAGDSFGQAKGTSIQTSKKGKTSDAVFTKSVDFGKGRAVTLDPVAGDITYTVYEKAGSTDDWRQTDSGKILVQDDKTVDICNKSAYRAKVEIKVPCDGCAKIETKECN